MPDDGDSNERNRLVILRRDLERRINPLVAREMRTDEAFTDAERSELRALRLQKADVERSLKRLAGRR
jgi:hypothetical protein